MDVQGVERLAFRVDPNVRVMLQHSSRQAAGDRFQYVVGYASSVRFTFAARGLRR
jgi:hypothetical protein